MKYLLLFKIPADLSKRISMLPATENPSLAFLQEAVGGYIERIPDETT